MPAACTVVTSRNGICKVALPIGKGTDYCVFDQEKGLAFSSNGGGDGTLTVVGPDPAGTYKVVANVPTQAGARTMAYDSANDRIYVATAEFGPRPAPTADHPHPRPSILPGTFTILVIGR